MSGLLYFSAALVDGFCDGSMRGRESGRRCTKVWSELGKCVDSCDYCNDGYSVCCAVPVPPEVSPSKRLAGEEMVCCKGHTV